MTKHSKGRVYLTDEDRAEIRRSRFTAYRLATIYNVSVNTIYYVLNPDKIRNRRRKAKGIVEDVGMTRDEAMEAMQEGKKVTHRFFGPDEWMTISNGDILLEDGVICCPNDFFKYRSDKSWQNGYRLYKQ